MRVPGLDTIHRVSLETLDMRLEAIDKVLGALAGHPVALSARHTRIVASLGIINTAPGLLIGLKEISAFMGLSPSSISRLRKYGFPTYRLGRHTVSHALEILLWVKAVDARRRR